MRLQEPKATVVIAIICVRVGIQRPRIHEERYRTASFRRISSIRSETSVSPLLPALAARNRRLPPPPRCASIASLVSSEIVFFLRAASWRRRASRSSVSFTVVRFMVCQHIKAGGCERTPREGLVPTSPHGLEWDYVWDLESDPPAGSEAGGAHTCGHG